MTFGQRLKHLMYERNVTQRFLSQKLNIAASTLNGYVNDYREPDFQTLLSLAGYFNVSTDYLLGITDHYESNADESEEHLRLLLSYYNRLKPKGQELLLDQATLLLKYNSAFQDPE